MGHLEHKKQALKSISFSVLTLSDTRTEAEDKSGSIIKESMLSAGHKLSSYIVIKEDPGIIGATLRHILEGNSDVVITNGGTGLTKRDGTIEVARKIFTKELEGFGELFRLLSFHQIGPSAMLSRATAGIANGKLLICLPGSSKGVRLALERIILPEVSHMVWEINR